MSAPLRQAGAEITIQAGRFEGDMLALTWPGLEAQHHLGNPEVDHQAGSVDDG